MKRCIAFTPGLGVLKCKEYEIESTGAVELKDFAL